MGNQLREAPELKWLKEGSINATPEGIDTEGKEYLRTMCSIRLLDYVLKNEYLTFVAVQPMNQRLSEDSFKEIRQFVTSILRTHDDKEAMKAYLIINDLGKVSDFVEKVKDIMGFESVNHDTILYEGLKEHPELSPTFASLKAKYRELILEGLETNFNMGQFVQSECLPVDLSALQYTKKRALDFYMVHVLFDIAGAAGHVHSTSSIICTEIYWKRFSWALEAINNMVKYAQNPNTAYRNYLKKTMEYFKLFSKTERQVDFCIARLYNLIRVTTVNEAKQVKKAFWNLSDSVRKTLTEELTKTGERGRDLGILMYYLPALFQNALKYYNKIDPNNAISLMISNVAPMVSDIFKNIWYLNPIGSTGEVVAFIADVAKEANDPEEMLKKPLYFVRVGNDFEVTTRENSDACLIFGQKTQKSKEV